MKPTEDQVGILAYLSTENSCTGILKYRFSDFIVREIPEGSTEPLKFEKFTAAGLIEKHPEFERPFAFIDIEQPQPQSEAGEPPQKAQRTEDGDGYAVTSTFTVLPKHKIRFSMEKVAEFCTFFEGQTELITGFFENLTNETAPEDLLIPVVFHDKSERGKIHKFIREHFYGFDSRTDKHGITLTKQRRSNRRRKLPPGFPKFVHFTMLKRGIDTLNATNNLCRLMRMKDKYFKVAGIKDKRGVTIQKCCVSELDPVNFHNVIGSLERLDKPIRLGNLSFEKEDIAVGKLWGNEFQIILRDVSEPETLKRNAELVGKNGFINYYGLQRFGNDAEYNTAMLGAACVKGDARFVIDSLISHPNPSDSEQLRTVKALVKEGKFNEAMQAADRRFKVQRNIIGGVLEGSRGESLLNYVPRKLRTLYVHAIQSLIFNRLVTVRLSMGHALMVGDLVDDPADDRMLQAIEITAENIGEHRFADIVIPCYGEGVRFPPVLEEAAATVLEELELTKDMFSNLKRIGVDIIGGYRRVIQEVFDMNCELFTYSDSFVDADLQKDPFTEAIGAEFVEPEPGTHNAARLTFRLCKGVFATMMYRELLHGSSNLSSMQGKTDDE
ncbi:hypothetical protein PCE1_001047 [Barthelona sp. PCE]